MSSQPDPEALRIGTAEREEAGRALGEHLAEGRLTPTEYEERVATAFAAQTRADLRPLFEDLPAPHPAFLAPPPSARAYPYAPPPPDASPPSSPPSAYHQPGPPAGVSDRSRIVAGVLQIVLPFGIGRFYTGHTGMAVAQLLVTLFTLGVGALWPLIDGILLLVNGGRDRYGRPLRD
ncbi:TM2 domain-containing protein [Prauserella shujinwangii]|uniref:TM2 domain-containing protein n=1 Tax=Prauserella shujinwangii TaxID=1453103 RepID=A0A2T0LRT4_9PSEU|nr:DUF1707 domain-containing protein [Prauserella shujinwangii]PRX46211.1 TM2 domain-containing protein [Prauserella shujinwangii]